MGYCQSMNFLVAVLLLVVDEESAFWCLCAIVERIMPGHFSSCMAMALVDQGVFHEFLQQEDPELVSHLESLQVAPSLVTSSWLLTCFVGSAVPLGALLRLWDDFFRERHIAYLFRVSAALLVTNRDAILASTDTGDAYVLLSKLGSELSETETLDALLRAVDALSSCALLEPEPLTAARRRHAIKLEAERGLQTSQRAVAAVATAAATASEVLAAPDETPAPPAAGTLHARGGWTLVCASTQPADDLDGWSLVERHDLPGGGPLSSLSYVILQIEAPRLLEEHFRTVSGANSGAELGGLLGSGVVSQAAARLDALA